MEPLIAAWQGSQTLLFIGLTVVGALWLAHMLTMRRALAMGRPRLARREMLGIPNRCREKRFLTKPFSLQ